MTKRFAGIVLTFATLSALPAAPIWTQVGMPGDLPATAQVTVGVGPLDAIVGALPVAVDSVHMYQIRIVDFANFHASTVNAVTDLSFDTTLSLFDSAGRGVYFNDDAEPNLDDIRAALPSGNPLGPQSNGLYYIAITGFGRFPHSSGGAIFPAPVNGEDVLGPTGPGGGQPISSWNGQDFSIDGPYRIDLTGTEFAQVPEPGYGKVFVVLFAVYVTLRLARPRRNTNRLPLQRQP